MDEPPAVTTVGHGTLPADQLVELLRAADVEGVVDVRSYPGSRRNPQYDREALSGWLPDAGIAYSWLPQLGGRRKGRPDSPHIALRDPAFRAYADHMETDDFAAGVDELLRLARAGSVAVMCSESVWWRCHRRLLADHLVLVREVPVRHLFHDGRIQPHPPMPEASVAEGDPPRLVYDLGVTPPMLS